MKHLHIPALCVFGLSLVACGSEVLTFKAVTTAVSAASNGFFSNPDVNLKEKNYAVADYVIGKVRKIVSPHDMILVKPLHESDNPGISSPLGIKISEEIGLRFAELGYTVRLGEGIEPLHNSTIEKQAPVYIFNGKYDVTYDGVDIVVRLQDVRAGRLLTQFDYVLPSTYEIRNMAKTEAQIFKVE